MDTILQKFFSGEGAAVFLTSPGNILCFVDVICVCLSNVKVERRKRLERIQQKTQQLQELILQVNKLVYTFTCTIYTDFFTYSVT